MFLPANKNVYLAGILLGNGNKYLCKGKEKQDDVLGEVALDWYDYVVRTYDIIIGRWYVLYPMIRTKLDCSSYGAFFNNPLRIIDPNGGIEYDVVNGNLVYRLGLAGNNMTNQLFY